MKKIYFYIILFYSLTCFSQNINYIKFPSNNQLFSRNTITNTAVIQTTGNVNQISGYTNLSLKVYRDDVLINTLNENLIYNDGIANFNFETPIIAELHNYSFKLYNNTTLLKESFNIVAGDLYLFQGQSNMRGEDTSTSALSVTNFIRSFGKFPVNTQDNQWFINDYVGGIAKSFAIELINEHNIPIAVINGALGGININAMQRNDLNHLDLGTNYGLMLNRFLLAGFNPADVRAMIFYQGEANSSDTVANYKNLFYQLKNDWQEDYAPPLYYLFQVHKGCGVTITTSQYEAQRQLSMENSNLKLISTNGVPQGPDLCHFQYNTAYSIFGLRLYNLVNYDIYNSGINNGIYSPTISNVRFTNSQKNQIRFDILPASDNYILEEGVKQDFFFPTTTSIVVNNASINGNIVTLNLTGSLNDVNAKLSYLGTNPNSNPIIKNQNNIGLINFKNVQINDINIVENTIDNWTYYFYESDLVNPIFGIEKLPTSLGANNNAFNTQVSISDNFSNISSSSGKEATYNLSKYWNVISTPIPNGWVNIRFFYNTTLQSNLLASAINFKNAQGASFISPLMFIQTNQSFNPINQISYNGFTIPIQKCGTSSNFGNYNSNDYVQINQVQLSTTTGGSAIIKVTNLYNGVAPGTLRFDEVSGKFQGWNGSNWLNFN